MSSTAVEFGNATQIVTPKSWLNKRIWCLTQDEYDDLKARRKKGEGKDV